MEHCLLRQLYFMQPASLWQILHLLMLLTLMLLLQSFIINYSWQIIDSVDKEIEVWKYLYLWNHQNLVRKAETWTHVLDESILIALFKTYISILVPEIQLGVRISASFLKYKMGVSIPCYFCGNILLSWRKSGSGCCTGLHVIKHIKESCSSMLHSQAKL